MISKSVTNSSGFSGKLKNMQTHSPPPFFVPSTALLVVKVRMTKNDDALAMQLGPLISHIN